MKMIKSFTIYITIVAIMLVIAIINLTSVSAEPIIKDSSLSVDIIVEDLSEPTGMTFLNGDIIVIQKDGNVKLISHDTLEQLTIFQFDVDTKSERGLLGIESNGKDLFFYLTDSNVDPLKNRVFKYSWNGNKLQNPQLLLDLPALPGPNHDAGKLVLDRNKQDGSTENLYIVIGDLNHNGILQNQKSTGKPDDTGVIFRIKSLDGSAVLNNPFSKDVGFSKYFAYGIRNSFGLTLDPATGFVWQTENGPESFDEINIAKSGFNSGWNAVIGPIDRTNKNENDLVMIPGAHYKDPILSWKESVALTDIEFLNSSKLGPKYYNNLFVGDYKNGNLYFLSLNQQREDVDINQYSQELNDRVIYSDGESSSVIFGEGFGGISDIETGPDGSLYVLSYENGEIYRISKN